MPRTRIRADQAQDISFVSEAELNQFFGKAVISGTVDSTAVLEDFNTYFPGRGLIVQQGQITVVTGSNFVSISGGDASDEDLVSASGSLQTQIDDIIFAAGVASITASGTTVSGAIVFEGAGDVNLSVDGQTITFSGSEDIAVSGEDIHHFSFEIIASGITKEIPFTHQMTVHENLDLEETGALLIEGTVILEI